MAIIYETKNDQERERLGREMRDADERSGQAASVGIFALGFAWMQSVVNKLTKFQNETLKKSPSFSDTVGKGLTWLYAAAGMALFVGAFTQYRKAKNLQAQRKNLGDQTVVVPNNTFQPNDEIGRGPGLAVMSESTYEKAKHVERLQSEIPSNSLAK